MKDNDRFSEPYGDVSLRVGRRQIDIEQRWEVASIINDIMVGLWFVAGSILAIEGSYPDLALSFFLVGSSLLLLRAILRLGRRVHIRRGYTLSRPRIYRPSRHDST